MTYAIRCTGPLSLILVSLLTLFGLGCDEHSADEGAGGAAGIPGTGGSGGSIPPAVDFLPQPAPVDPQDVPLEDARRTNCTVVEDAYGPYDRLPFEKTVFFYDEVGRLTASEFDAGANGTLERTTRRIIDGQGRLILEEVDEGGEGIPDLRFMLEYDDAGRLSAQEQDSDGDGYPDVRREFSYGPDERLISEAVYGQPDGVLLERTMYTYGNADAPVLVEHFQGPMQTLSWRLDSVYDALGRPVERVLFENSNSETQRSTTGYDDAERLSREELDVDGDGTLDARIIRRYDAWNRLNSVETDVSADDLIEVRVTYRWESDLLSAVESDTDGDGTLNESRTYLYDDRGRILRKVRDRDASDMLGGERWEYTYHCVP